MANITLEEIKEFLREKPGYRKEGGKRLKNIFLRRGFTTTIAMCKEAIRQVNRETSLIPVTKDIKTPKILFYDIEVSYGLARVWRPGWKVRVSYDDFEIHPKIICISYKWSDEDTVHTVQWDSKHDDKNLLEMFIPEMNKADFIVAHNGDKFDLPWVKTRALAHGIPMYPKYTSVDTFKEARYNHNFPSNRLDDIGDYLGLGRKIPTNRKLWVDTVNGDPDALNEMITYCEQDVRLLEAVYNKLSEMMLPKVHVGTLNELTKQTSPHSGSKNLELIKTTTTKAGTIKRLMKDLDTNKYFEFSNTDYKKYIEINK